MVYINFVMINWVGFSVANRKLVHSFTIFLIFSGLNTLIDSGIVDTLISILDEKLDNQPIDHIRVSPKKLEEEKQSSTAKTERQPSHMKRNLELSPTAHRLLKIPKFDYYEPESPGSSNSGYASGSFYPGPSSPTGSCYSPASTPPRILGKPNIFSFFCDIWASMCIFFFI
jgi:hypothetical protein